MTLRDALGADARRVHELVDQLLDREDALIVLIDKDRAVSYGEGFGLSPCQLEFMTNEIEQTVRTLAGRGGSDGARDGFGRGDERSAPLGGRP